MALDVHDTILLSRLRINSCGIVDVLLYDTRQDITITQQEDLVLFGRLLVALCCNSLAALSALPKALDTIGRIYSSDIQALALFLVSKPAPLKVSFRRPFDLRLMVLHHSPLRKSSNILVLIVYCVTWMRCKCW